MEMASLKPLGVWPWFCSQQTMSKPKVAVRTPSQNSRAGDDGNRAGGVHGFLKGFPAKMMRFSDGEFEYIMDIT